MGTRNGFTDFDAEFDRDFKRAGKAFGAWFVFCGLMAVAVTGVVLWAIVAVVQHFT